MDPEWVKALEESSKGLGEGDTITAEALARSERRVLSRLRKMAPSNMKTVLLSRNTPEKPGDTPYLHRKNLHGHLSCMHHASRIENPSENWQGLSATMYPLRGKYIIRTQKFRNWQLHLCCWVT